LLSQILMAATYPLEVVEAARWSKANPNLKGDAAVKAVQDKAWDVSVKSLVAFPQVVQQMSDQLEWTQKLGDALLAQHEDVAASVQRLRALAQKSGNLKSGEQQKVTVQPAPAAGGATPQTIIIEPADPQVVYVPSYQPAVYGEWPYPASPPTYYPPYPGYGYGAAIATGFVWGAAIAGGAALYGGWGWGSGDVNVNVDRAVNIDRNFNRDSVKGGNWQHSPEHRKGVAYRDSATRQQYGKGVAGADARQQFRGKEMQSPGAGGQRPGVGGQQRPGGGAGVGGDRPGGAAGGGPRAGVGGDRPGAGAGGQQRAAVGGQQRAGGGAGAGAGAQQRPAAQPRAGGAQGGAFQGVDRGGQHSREVARGHQSVGRSAGGGGGGGRGGGGGGGGRGGGGGGRR
jgi:hypothetical protein